MPSMLNIRRSRHRQSTVGMDLVEVVAYRYGSCGRGRTGARLAGRSRGSE